MLHTNQEHKTHLNEILKLVSTYKVLSQKQLIKWFPELPEKKTLSLIQQLQRKGRLFCLFENEYVSCIKDYSPDFSLIAAFWLLLDFQPHVIYYTASDFPVTLTFYTKTDGFHVIHVPYGKELLINHAMGDYADDDLTNLVIVENISQISSLTIPGVGAYCTVSPDGQVQYYQKQGVTIT